MKRIVHELVQGTPEWMAHRSVCHNASDLASAMGRSRYKQRSSLIRELATGFVPDIDAETNKRFHDGHRFERLARPLAEEIVGESLFPITVSCTAPGLDRPLSASLDGSTMDGLVNWEHKSLNADLSAALDRGIIPPEYHPQMEQGMYISGATRTLFMASSWDEDDRLIQEKHCWYESDPYLLEALIPTWQQIEEDARNYQEHEIVPAIIAAPQTHLPAVSVQVRGEIAIIDNLSVFGDALIAYVERINKRPQRDQDFADLEATIKTLKAAENALDAAENSTLGQAASIDALRRTVAQYRDLARSNRLLIEKLVKSEKENRRNTIVQGGKKALDTHVYGLNERLGQSCMPPIQSDFPGAIRGLKTLSSIQNAVDTELARCKIEANAIADVIDANLKVLRELGSEHKFLFADANQLILKESNDLIAVVQLRIAEHRADAAKRLDAEREHIRQEEASKLAISVSTVQAAVAKTHSSDQPNPVHYSAKDRPIVFDLVSHLRRQNAFSNRTFGPGVRTTGILDHIRKELDEIEANPKDLWEWVDVIILALDGAWREGHSPEEIALAIAAKQELNERRQWPDWRTAEPGKAIEHVRGGRA